MSELERRLTKLLERQRKLRDSLFGGPMPSFAQALVIFGKDQMLTEIIDEVKRELKGDPDD